MWKVEGGSTVMFSLTLKKKREVVKYKRTNTHPCVLLVHSDWFNIHRAHFLKISFSHAHFRVAGRL